MRAATACPIDQKADSMTRRYWWVAGIYSRKIALSTGWLPPDPTPMKAQKVAIATKLGDPAPTRPARPEIAAKWQSQLDCRLFECTGEY